MGVPAVVFFKLLKCSLKVGGKTKMTQQMACRGHTTMVTQPNGLAQVNTPCSSLCVDEQKIPVDSILKCELSYLRAFVPLDMWSIASIANTYG